MYLCSNVFLSKCYHVLSVSVTSLRVRRFRRRGRRRRFYIRRFWNIPPIPFRKGYKSPCSHVPENHLLTLKIMSTVCPRHPLESRVGHNTDKITQANELKDQGNKAFQAKDYDVAIDLFTKAIELDPQNHVLFSNRSAAKAGNKQWTAALEDAETVCELRTSASDRGFV